MSGEFANPSTGRNKTISVQKDGSEGWLTLYDVLIKTTNYFCSPYHVACQYNHLHTVEYFYKTLGEKSKTLIEAVSKERNNNNESPLQIVYKYNNTKIMKILLNEKFHADINRGGKIKLYFVRSGQGKCRPVDVDNFNNEKKFFEIDIIIFIFQKF